ncbi:hypothetical protein AC578_7222 [Pseudocercospora eumusae]|uniref:Ferric oxidoreductase domain-containing protein n=1 Tax=Pseudocercospora eumusae TaxID=321146 RepID=A0A139HWB8_9PEZI|nr:hypothetical protein AC578_7222 [Pseudocercospora eumusae]
MARITMYKPTCATACRDSVSNPLMCSDNSSAPLAKRMGGMSMQKPSAECYANNDPFLESVAYCISSRCHDVPEWRLEQWWAKRIVGRQSNQPPPKQTWQQTLAKISTPPNSTVPSDQVLRQATLVSDETYQSNYNGDGIFEVNEATHVRYGLVLLLGGAGIPIALSLLRFAPFSRHMVSRFNAIFIDPPAFGNRHRVPWLNTFVAPTRGQALFIAYLWMINIVLCSVGYEIRWPDAWYTDSSQETATYISYRTGVVSFANLALLVLYAGRNNVLLWVTNWSHSTFLLLHRWIAFICCLQACIHSAMLLQIYLNSPGYDYTSESKQPYWIWGIVATLGLVIFLPTSLLPLRKKMYELFLAWHVVLSFFVLLGCYWHVVEAFGHQWGYETWIYIAFACWAFDRLLRILRIARNGVRHAQVTVLSDEYIRLDIPEATGTGDAYLYFPTLSWRFWENHPFSVAGILLPAEETSALSDHSCSSAADIEKSALEVIEPVSSSPSQHGYSMHRPSYRTGLTFFIRAQGGLTSKLSFCKEVPVLIESPYGSTIIPDEGLYRCANLVCIAGGVGITAILAHLSSHVGASKLYWGVRTDALVAPVQNILQALNARTETTIVQGRRLELRTILEQEIAVDGGRGTRIVVSGPASMADDVRSIVCDLMKQHKTAVIHFKEESYSW